MLSNSPALSSDPPPSRLVKRRESARPGLSRISTRASTVEALETPMPSDPPPLVKSDKYILRKWKGFPPSFAIHLYPTYFRLHQLNDNWPYDSPMAAILKHIHHREIPHDFLEELYDSNVPWYDGMGQTAFTVFRVIMLIAHS